MIDFLEKLEASKLSEGSSSAVDKKITAILHAVEHRLSRDARFKSFGVDVENKVVDWVTQETHEMEAKKEAAAMIAKVLGEKGYKGWTVKVTVRDDNRTKWATAKS